jgi:hypothetical protein
MLEEAGKIFGLDKITSEQAAQLKQALGMFMTMPQSKLAKLLIDDDNEND